jgi:hypothetical protein
VELGERGRAAGQRGDRDPLEVAGEQERPPDRGDRHLGRLGDRVGEQAGLGTLAQLAAEQPDQQPLLVGGRGGEEGAEQIAPATTEIAAIAASTAPTVSVASAAGSGRSRRLA